MPIEARPAIDMEEVEIIKQLAAIHGFQLIARPYSKTRSVYSLKSPLLQAAYPLASTWTNEDEVWNYLLHPGQYTNLPGWFEVLPKWLSDPAAVINLLQSTGKIWAIYFHSNSVFEWYLIEIDGRQFIDQRHSRLCMAICKTWLKWKEEQS